jgi:hypothetical protein
MRVVSEPGDHVRLELGEVILARRLALPRRSLAVQVGADGLAVLSQVGGDRADRPAAIP